VKNKNGNFIAELSISFKVWRGSFTALSCCFLFPPKPLNSFFLSEAQPYNALIDPPPIAELIYGYIQNNKNALSVNCVLFNRHTYSMIKICTILLFWSFAQSQSKCLLLFFYKELNRLYSDDFLSLVSVSEKFVQYVKHNK
jgi:hypothetical protein